MTRLVKTADTQATIAGAILAKFGRAPIPPLLRRRTPTAASIAPAARRYVAGSDEVSGLRCSLRVGSHHVSSHYQPLARTDAAILSVPHPAQPPTQILGRSPQGRENFSAAPARTDLGGQASGIHDQIALLADEFVADHLVATLWPW